MDIFLHKKTPGVTFEEVICEYEQPLYWHIRRMVASHDDASDILQETFIHIYKGLSSLREKAALRSWVYRIATNECLRFLSRRKEISLTEENSFLADQLESSPGVDLSDGTALRFQKAVLSLSPQQRTVFTLRYYDDLSYEEIAEVTGSSVQTLKVAYHYAKEKIKNAIIS